MTHEHFMPDMPNATPEIFIDTTKFSFGNKLEVGEKGAIDFTSVIVRERLEEEDSTKLKTLRLLNASLQKEETRRM